jgi:hypothetical protein
VQDIGVTCNCSMFARPTPIAQQLEHSPNAPVYERLKLQSISQPPFSLVRPLTIFVAFTDQPLCSPLLSCSNPSLRHCAPLTPFMRRPHSLEAAPHSLIAPSSIPSRAPLGLLFHSAVIPMRCSPPPSLPLSNLGLSPVQGGTYAFIDYLDMQSVRNAIEVHT